MPENKTEERPPQLDNVRDNATQEDFKMKNKVKLIVNPFIRIAGGQALIWGFLGLIVSTLLCWISGCHYHGLLHFGPAPNPAWWCYLAEHLIVWLIPALLFYLGGLFLSHSRIRVIDVLGTVLFAQLPLFGMNLISLLPAMRMMNSLNALGLRRARL